MSTINHKSEFIVLFWKEEIIGSIIPDNVTIIHSIKYLSHHTESELFFSLNPIEKSLNYLWFLSTNTKSRVAINLDYYFVHINAPYAHK